jgi:hypothetical protein
MAALDIPYAEYVRINGGEHCGICGKVPEPGGRRLDRDHEHKGVGAARGLLCFACNRQLRTWATVDWLSAAIAYLKRHEGRHDGDSRND